MKFMERGGVATDDVLIDIRNLLKEIPGVNITVDRPADGPPAGAPINIEVAGDNYEQF